MLSRAEVKNGFYVVRTEFRGETKFLIELNRRIGSLAENPLEASRYGIVTRANAVVTRLIQGQMKLLYFAGSVQREVPEEELAVMPASTYFVSPEYIASQRVVPSIVSQGVEKLKQKAAGKPETAAAYELKLAEALGSMLQGQMVRFYPSGLRPTGGSAAPFEFVSVKRVTPLFIEADITERNRSVTYEFDLLTGRCRQYKTAVLMPNAPDLCDFFTHYEYLKTIDWSSLGRVIIDDVYHIVQRRTVDEDSLY